MLLLKLLVFQMRVQLELFDVHVFHSVWSALVLTRWSSKPAICCQSCGTKSRLGGAASSMVLGWWGFPWGLILTPVQVSRNVIGMWRDPEPQRPSPMLERAVRVHLAQQLQAQRAAS